MFRQQLPPFLEQCHNLLIQYIFLPSSDFHSEFFKRTPRKQKRTWNHWCLVLVPSLFSSSLLSSSSSSVSTSIGGKSMVTAKRCEILYFPNSPLSFDLHSLRCDLRCQELSPGGMSLPSMSRSAFVSCRCFFGIIQSTQKRNNQLYLQ